MNPLRFWRHARRRSQTEIAALLGISITSLSRVERGIQWPAPEVLSRIKEVTNGGVSADDMLASLVPIGERVVTERYGLADASETVS